MALKDIFITDLFSFVAAGPHDVKFMSGQAPG
jgi:hypothetical protein